MRVAVLSLQGGVKEHISMLSSCGVTAFRAKKPAELKKADALVLPGGESTTMSLLSPEILPALKRAIASGKPVLGTCAGAILLAKRVGEKRGLLGFLDAEVKRNAYGGQLESFEAGLKIKGIGSFPGVFIRAPVFTKTGKNVEILSSFEKKPVFVRQGKIFAAAFHPELTEDKRVHGLFLDSAAQVL